MQFLKKLFGGNTPSETVEPLVKTDVALTDLVNVPSSGISLVKKFETEAPQLVNLAKTASISLEKKNLTDVRAMCNQYSTGVVQKVLDRIIPLAVHFDQDAVLDCWAFASDMKQLPSITLKNINGYLDAIGLKNCGADIGIGYDNNEPIVIKDIINTHKQSGTTLPTYVVFITDGGITRSKEIETLIVEAAKESIFWQFVGIGGSSYGILENLDNMKGRVIDNCDFFSLDRLSSVSESSLYDMLLNEFPQWIKEARRKGIL